MEFENLSISAQHNQNECIDSALYTQTRFVAELHIKSSRRIDSLEYFVCISVPDCGSSKCHMDSWKIKSKLKQKLNNANLRSLISIILHFVVIQLLNKGKVKVYLGLSGKVVCLKSIPNEL